MLPAHITRYTSIHYTMSGTPKIPTFEELKKRDGPPLNAWGIWGKDNELGQINHLTPEAVKRGRDAIKHGKAVNLK